MAKYGSVDDPLRMPTQQTAKPKKAIVIDGFPKVSPNHFRLPTFKEVVILIGLTALAAGAAGAGYYFIALPRGNPVSLDAAKYAWHYETLRADEDGKCDPDNIPLVIFSMDGLAKDYFDRGILRNFDFIAERGVKAEGVFPSFQSKTFPNHMSIATGLYPGFHGIVDAWMYDPRIKARPIDIRKPSPTERQFYDSGEPFWTTFHRQTGKKVACFQFPGCPHYPESPFITEPYQPNRQMSEVFGWVLEQLAKPSADRPSLILGYMDEPDATRHGFKGDSNEVRTVLERLDTEMAKFLNELYQTGRLGCTNFAFLSDHGFMDVRRNVDLSGYDFGGEQTLPGVVTRIHRGENGPLPSAYFEKAKCERPRDGFKIYDKKLLPPRLHFSDHPRVGDIFLLSEPGVEFKVLEPGKDVLGSNHGWDYLAPEMTTVFYAMGPAFKRGALLAPFQNVEYYNLFSEILGVEPVRNNGTLGKLWPALKMPKNDREDPFYDGSKDMDDCKHNAMMWKTPYRAPMLMPFKTMAGTHAYCLRSEKQGIVIATMVPHREGRLYIESHHGPWPGSPGRFAQFERLEQGNPPAATPQFWSKIWEPLQKLVWEWQEKQLGIVVYSGYTHFRSRWYAYRIIVRCENNFLQEYYCQEPAATRTLSFLVPMDFEDPNCLPTDRLLLSYTARIRDIELYSGFHLMPYLPYHIAVNLKTNITMELW